MESRVVVIPTTRIVDWASFHAVFADVFGFPAFYGRNMDAWIDCMTSIDQAEDGMSAITVSPGELLVIQIDGDLKYRCPEQYQAIIKCSAFVNQRRVEVGEAPVLALLLS